MWVRGKYLSESLGKVNLRRRDIYSNLWSRKLNNQGFIWDKVFKNGPSKICERQPLKNLPKQTYHFKLFKGCLPQVLLSPFLNILSHTFKKSTFAGRWRKKWWVSKLFFDVENLIDTLDIKRNISRTLTILRQYFISIFALAENPEVFLHFQGV